MTYGVPYQGSKSRIAKDIIEQLPTGKRFVDLFAGGCAMTHAAILSQKYEKFLCNDLYPHGVNLFKNALNGEYSKPEYLRWVSREEFFAKKDTDDFVKMCYSFGNDGKSYMYSKELEPLKKGFHYAVVFDDWTYLEQYAKANNWREGLIDELKGSVGGSGVEERRLCAERTAKSTGLRGTNSPILVHLMGKKRLDEINERRLKLTKPAYDNGVIGLPHNMVQSLERMNRLQNLELINERRRALHKFTIDLGIQQPNQRLLSSLSCGARINNIKELATGIDIDFTSFDYRDYLHEEGDVVYCDPPYYGMKKYDGREFNHEEFWDWVRTSDYPVYVSEYNAPDDFVCVWQKEKVRMAGGGKSAHQKAIEHLYIHNSKLNSERI